VDPAPLLRTWRIAAPLTLVFLAAALVRSERARAFPLATAGALWTVALFLLPSVPAHAVAIPIVLLAAGALQTRPVSGATPRMPGR
jgi:hypothetical protein